MVVAELLTYRCVKTYKSAAHTYLFSLCNIVTHDLRGTVHQSVIITCRKAQ